MPGEIVLPLDLTGVAVTNRITGEEHTLDSTTGKCFALNYGGFYSASLRIRDASTNTLLNPVTDYIVVGPYDDITRQTGKEAACAVLITRTVWQGDYIIDEYQAVGGEFATNVQALRDVIEDFQQNVNSVHWNSIVGIPEGFDPAPHLIDFRKEVIGFEGLISSINEIADILGSPSTGEIAAIQAIIESKMNNRDSEVDNEIAALNQRIDNLPTPDTSGFVSGSPALNSDVASGNDPTKFMSASNIETLKKRVNSFYSLPGVNTSAFLNTTREPFIYGNFNLRTGGAGDASVPNSNEIYFIVNMTLTSGLSLQIAFSIIQGGGTARFPMYARFGNLDQGSFQLWYRMDQGVFGTAAARDLIVTASSSSGGTINWENPSAVGVTSANTVKQMIEAHISTGRALASGAIANLDTTTVPTQWVNGNFRAGGRGDTTVPNVNLYYMVRTFVNPHLTNTLTQFAYTYHDSKYVTLARNKTSSGVTLWTRTDIGSLGDISTWVPANLNTGGHYDWTFPTQYMSNDAFVTPYILKETIRRNTNYIYPIGMISIWSEMADKLPSNFAVCNGSNLSRLNYSSLFDLVGTRYGSTNSTNFNLPDLRGYIVRGLDTRTGSTTRPDMDRSISNESLAINNYQGDAMQVITGTMSLPLIQRATPSFTGAFSSPGTDSVSWSSASGGAGAEYRRVINFTNNISGVRTSQHETRMKNKTFHYVIKTREMPGTA